MTPQTDPAAPTTSPALPHVRPRADPDLDACVQVLAAVHAHDGYPVNWPLRPREWLAGTAQSGAWVAELDGAVVGHIGLARADDGDAAPGLFSSRTGMSTAETAVVSRLFVSPDARGHRIGALLLEHAVREAHGLGLHPVLDVVATDTAAAALYERQGWELLATTEQQWAPGRTVVLHSYAAGRDGDA
ncbi:GNAT family N-acetyltransferase [Streptomyces sp. NPDC059009]|uniref:GNAT family N-acetyltransferase n=1 Tax=Streptomyces sp. NPDC059009 TaxID=3346694 RepID=UPI0036A8B6C6